MTSPFKDNPDGSREFVCSDCGSSVLQAVNDGFDFPVCWLCRYFSEHPQIPAEVRDRITGRGHA